LPGKATSDFGAKPIRPDQLTKAIPHAKFAERLLEWHGGQWSALYSVGSCLLAESRHWRDKLPEAVQELRRAPKDEAQGLAATLEAVGKLDDFTLAYIACAFWCSNDESTPSGGDPLEKRYSIADVAPETLNKMASDCAAFQRTNAPLLEACGLGAEEAGHDFWLTRNRHGSGFWDEDIGDVGRQLTEAACACGECNLYVGDDQRIYGL